MSTFDLDVLIVGGGVSGLSALHALAQAPERPRVLLCEASERVGGVVGTDRVDGFVIDRGPDSFVAQKPEGKALCEALGLGAELTTPREEARKVYLRSGDTLRAMPDGMVLGLPTGAGAFLRSDFMPWTQKLRMAMDLVLPRGKAEDESIAEFMARRFGRGSVATIAEPLLAGIHSGRADELSMRANFPMLVELERKHRSVIRGLRKSQSQGHGKGRGPAFWALRGGMGQLIDALVAAVPQSALRLRAPAEALQPLPGGGFEVRAGGARLRTRHLLLAIRSHVAAPLLRPFASALADALAQIDYASSAIAYFGFERAQVEHPLDAFGFVSTQGAGRVMAGTFVSSKLDGRAPEGRVLLRAFFGGARDEAVLRESDASLCAIAREELGGLLGLRGEPVLQRVYRYDRATPQMRVGHKERVATLRAAEAELPGLALLGAGYEGVGIPECIRQGQAAARRALQSLSGAEGAPASDGSPGARATA